MSGPVDTSPTPGCALPEPPVVEVVDARVADVGGRRGAGPAAPRGSARTAAARPRAACVRRDVARRPRRLVPRQPAVGRTVTVEVALIPVDERRRLGYRLRRATAARSAAPHQVALELAELPPRTDGVVVHATNWRYEDAGHLVLTYAAMPRDRQQADASLLGVGVLSPTAPLHPTPTGLHEHHVVAHAARHLAYLAQHDQTVRDTARPATRTAPRP